MKTTREQVKVDNPKDSHRMLDIVMDMTIEDDDFAARVRGGEMRLVSKFVERDDLGMIVSEGYVIEVTFPERDRSAARNRWSVQQERLLISA